ncbi:lysophospholipase [Sneathiella sp. CAU 1612]|uniref:Lysophospholipase n=1 Tax=Sneathiella sedimenti TaxID=2816034 RepID=A0ABS3F4Q5_9PROT|nr:alpha/beta hydrolase [Sneathiella sedimenti]MBO0333463.1 lysophospholipase [Sneathiella sedimenti]
MSEYFTYSGADGLPIHVYRWMGEKKPKAIVQIAHGMAEHGARYERFAQALNEFGYIVYANDHRGHGHTIPEGDAPGHMGDQDGWNKAVEDLYLLNRNIAVEHPGLPILMLGHSMGSFMVQQYMRQHGETIAGAALSATNGPPGALGRIGQLVTRFERLRVSARGHSPVMAGMTFKAFNKPFAPNRTEFDWLSRDEAEVDKYVDDPLCGFDCTVATWLGLLDALTRVASPAAMKKMNRQMPIFVFSGSEDPVGENTTGVKRLLAAYHRHGFTRVTHKFYIGGRHEMLNETNRDEVTTDFIAWANSVIG